MDYRFDWNTGKNQSNLEKYGISFEEAQTAFSDENADLMRDPDDSGEEERFILLGLTSKLRILAVCHCYRESDEVIRIISARKANPLERSKYEELL